MLVKQSSLKTPQTLVNPSGELRPINKASQKEGHIVNLLGVGISQDMVENEAADEKWFRVGNGVADSLPCWTPLAVLMQSCQTLTSAIQSHVLL